MHRSLSMMALLLMTGCTGPHPYVREGDANAVEVTYAGDIASALPLAQAHCARFERQAQLRLQGADFADFDCVPR